MIPTHTGNYGNCIDAYNDLKQQLSSNAAPPMSELERRVHVINEHILKDPMQSQEIAVEKDDVVFLNKTIKQRVWAEVKGLDRVLLAIKAVASFITFGYYQYAPQIDTKPFIDSVVEFNKNVKICSVAKQLDAPTYTSAPVIHGKTECYYPSKENGKYFITIGNEDASKKYECSFDRLGSGYVRFINPLDPAVDVFELHLDGISENVKPRELSQALFTAIEDHKDIKSYGEQAFIHHALPFIKEQSMVQGHNDILAIGPKSLSSIFVLSNTHEGCVLTVWNRDSRRFVDESIRFDVNGKITLTNIAPPNGQREFASVQAMLDSVKTSNCQFIDAADRLAKLAPDQQTAIKGQCDMLVARARKLNFFVEAGGVQHAKDALRQMSSRLAGVDAGCFIYQESPATLVFVDANEERRLVILQDGRVRFAEQVYEPKTALDKIVPIANAKTLQQARELYVAKTSNVSSDDTAKLSAICTNLRASGAYYNFDSPRARLMGFENFFGDDSQELVGAWVLTPGKVAHEESKGFFANVLGMLQGAATFLPRKVYKKLEPNFIEKRWTGNFQLFTLSVSDGKGYQFLEVEIDPQDAKKPYRYQGVPYESPEAILQKEFPELALKTQTDVQKSIDACEAFEQRLEQDRFFVSSDVFAGFTKKMPEISFDVQSALSYVVLPLNKPGLYKVKVFGIEQEIVFSTRAPKYGKMVDENLYGCASIPELLAKHFGPQSAAKMRAFAVRSYMADLQKAQDAKQAAEQAATLASLQAAAEVPPQPTYAPARQPQPQRIAQPQPVLQPAPVVPTQTAPSVSLSSHGKIPETYMNMFGYTNSDPRKQAMARLVVAKAYFEGLKPSEWQAVKAQVLKLVFVGITKETALKLLGSQKGTANAKDRLEDLGIGSYFPKDELFKNLKSDQKKISKNALFTFVSDYL